MPVFVNWLLRLVITNPICVRLVQGGSRRARHFYIRTGYLAALILVLIFVLLGRAGGSDLSYRDLAAAGAASFQGVSYLQVLVICLITPVFMAGAIVQESNPRTWDVILTTPLSATQIILGNLFGRLFFVLALLLSSLPLFAVTQYFGGVPGKPIFLSYAIAACSALLVGSIAVMLSVTRTGGRRAVFIFYTAVIAYLATTFAIDRVLNIGSATDHVTWMTAINPFLAIRALLEPANYALPDPVSLAAMPRSERVWLGSPVAVYCTLSTLLSVFLMVFSAVSLRLIATHTGNIPWYRRMFGLGTRGSLTRPPRHVWNNPVAWREAMAKRQSLGKILGRWGFVLLGMIAALLLLAAHHSGTFTPGTFRYSLISLVGAELAIVSLSAINMSATAVSREREDGTLDLLLTTTITPSAYLRGKLRGLFTYLLPMTAVPVVTMMLVGLYIALHGLGTTNATELTTNVGTASMTLPVVMPEVLVAAPLTIPAFIAFCVMVGLQTSLKSKGTIGSVVLTVSVLLIVFAILSFCGQQAGENIPIVGTILAMISPATMLNGAIFPESALAGTLETGGTSAVRLNLVIGSAITGAIFTVVVYAMHMNMVRTFDVTVRRLTGTS